MSAVVFLWWVLLLVGIVGASALAAIVLRTCVRFELEKADEVRAALRVEVAGLHASTVVLQTQLELAQSEVSRLEVILAAQVMEDLTKIESNDVGQKIEAAASGQRPIPRSGPDPECSALLQELQRRYPHDEVDISRCTGGRCDISVRIGTFALNRRRAFSLTTDTAERALECVDEWEKELAAAVATPVEIRVACCMRCGDPVGVALKVESAFVLPHICPKCEGSTVETFMYLLDKDRS